MNENREIGNVEINEAEQVPEIGNLGGEYPEVGSLASEYPEIGAAVGLLQQKMIPLASMMVKAAAAPSVGPVTLASLNDHFLSLQAEVDALQAKLHRANYRKPGSPPASPGRGTSAQAVIMSDPTAGGIAVAAGKNGIPFIITNNKGYPVDLARLRVEAFDPVLNVPARGVGIEGIEIDGENYGDGNTLAASNFDPLVPETVPLNWRLDKNGEITGTLRNDGAVGAICYVSAVCYPAGTHK